MLAVNCFGPFLFTKLLHPVIESTAKSSPAGSVRVVWLGSLMIQLMAPKGGIDLDNLDYKKKWLDEYTRYSASKAGNLFIGSEWARRDAGNGILHLVSESVFRRHLSRFQKFLTICQRDRLSILVISKHHCSATCLRLNTTQWSVDYLCKASEDTCHANAETSYRYFMIPSTVHTRSCLPACLQMSSQSTVDNTSCLGVDLAQLVQILISLCLHKTEKTHPMPGNSLNTARTRRNPLHRNFMRYNELVKAGGGLAGICAR